MERGGSDAMETNDKRQEEDKVQVWECISRKKIVLLLW